MNPNVALLLKQFPWFGTPKMMIREKFTCVKDLQALVREKLNRIPAIMSCMIRQITDDHGYCQSSPTGKTNDRMERSSLQLDEFELNSLSYRPRLQRINRRLLVQPKYRKRRQKS